MIHVKKFATHYDLQDFQRGINNEQEKNPIDCNSIIANYIWIPHKRVFRYRQMFR